MLWMKNWMETRWRVLSAIGVIVVLSFLFTLPPREGPNPNASVGPEARLGFFISGFFFFFVMEAVILASAGIKTQAPFRTNRGLHGSMHFTLSLPVSRMRIMATRITMGIAELLAFIFIGTVALRLVLIPKFPELHFSLGDFAAYLVTTFAVVAMCFFLATLLSTFLDDAWQAWGTLILLGLIRGLSTLITIPESIDPFRTVSMGSPLVTHSIPWAVVAVSVAMCGVLLLGSMKLVQNRDY